MRLKKSIIPASAIICVMALVAYLCMPVTAAHHNLSGKWMIEDFTRAVDKGIETHISGYYFFNDNDSVEAHYRCVTVISDTEVGHDDKSMYFDLHIDCTGPYSLNDRNLNINPENITEKSFSIGEGTYDNMGPGTNDPYETELVRPIFFALTYKTVEGLLNLKINNVKINENIISGTAMDTNFTIIRTD